MNATTSLLLVLFACVAAPVGFPQGGDDAPPPERTPEQTQPARPQRGGADPSDDAFEFGSPPALPEGMTEEEMWPAATAEEWREPCLVHWQRSFDDALRVAGTRNQPILVAVNMDGEIASEHFAGVKYRDPEVATLMSQYVCVIASVYRHTPRDYDTDGVRVPCPRFGTVTCGEHIQAERELYGKYFDGRRISPRHIVLEPDGVETFDVFYSWDTATVSKMVVAGLEGRPEPLPSPEPTLENLARSAAVADREALERMVREGDRETKRRVLLALLEDDALDQVEVLRAGIFGLDLELARLARRGLAKCETEGALDLMADALKVPLGEDERQLLLDAVDRMAATSRRARTLATLHSGLEVGSEHIDAAALESLERAYRSAGATATRARADAADDWSADPSELLDLAEGLVTRARTSDARFRSLLLSDARSALADARELGADAPRLRALEALVALESGDVQRASELAVAAVEGGLVALDGGSRAEADPPLGAESLERVLHLFGSARRGAIRAAYASGVEWDARWLSDTNAAYALLAESPRVEVATLLEHHDFLRWLGASPRANRVLDAALERFPAAPELHQRLRDRLLWEGGPKALEAAYGARLERLPDPAVDPDQLHWYAGYASLVAAEHHRRRSRFDEALESYGRSLQRFGQNAAQNPEGADSARHYMALVDAGRARVLMERGELAAATEALLSALERRPDSAASQDGLGITPIATAKMLEAKLLSAESSDEAARVRAALDALDPALLEPPPSERAGSGRRR